MIVPGDRGNFIEFGTAVSRRVGLGRVFEIPNVDLEEYDSISRMYAVGILSDLAINGTGRKEM